MPNHVDPRRALVFGQVAADYARFRPACPDAAVDWLTDGASVVAELGAGTGQLTGKLLERAMTVHAVEPDERMLAVLRREFPAALAHHESADSIPLADHSVDAVVSADAWHWFPVEETVAEVRRVLRPGGWLGLACNVPAPQSTWEFELAGVDPDKKESSPADRAGFGPFPDDESTRENFPWAWPVDPESFRGYLATNSALIMMEPGERQERLDAAEVVVRHACQALGTTSVAMHHTAACFRWTPAP
ncbi:MULTISPECIES: class I SAM-dependent methyltransferase [unclassified Nocardioides]|uniref:class I SAM-dependent methyltransferase n=1 Tax=unclassified Nocardioides TaxID=2615069 RepID=UPI0009E96605|nr:MULTISPECIES: class I SAM-dependent methyltransferase [unclassified Nocardioides]